MAKDIPIHPHTAYPFKRICWSAIFVGALVAVGLSFLFNLFGIAIGLTAFTMDKNGALGFAIGGAISIFIVVIISMLVAGYAAGYLGRHFAPRKNLGILYGFATWTVAILMSAAVIGHISNYTAVYSHDIGNTSYKMYHDSHYPGSETVTVKESEPHQSNTAKQITLSKDSLATGAFLIFGLFFIGALATCVGATCGMSCRRED
ncbi:MAG: hypothetical protein CK424_06620 [Legionella sp.]|nr:MAG: hypothetical protein CK424_06620 [Legionella sp.]